MLRGICCWSMLRLRRMPIFFEIKRRQQATYWMYESINQELKTSFYMHPQIKSLLKEMEAKVIAGEISSFIAARRLLDSYKNQ